MSEEILNGDFVLVKFSHNDSFESGTYIYVAENPCGQGHYARTLSNVIPVWVSEVKLLRPNFGKRLVKTPTTPDEVGK